MKTCETCGKTSEDVRLRVDPFMEEIYGEEVWVTICDECENESAMEI